VEVSGSPTVVIVVRTVVRSHCVFVLSPEILQNYPKKWGDEASRDADAIRQI
jgi:hypothetical protein